MQKNTTPFQKWYQKHIQECRHIPTFAGKKAMNNLFVIYALASKGDLSCWDLALEYVRQTEANFNILKPDTVYHKRQVANATLNRSLLTLQFKGYVSKQGTLYTLTFKGMLFAFMLDVGLFENFFAKFTDEEVASVLHKPDDILPSLNLPKSVIQKMRNAISTEIGQALFKNVLRNVFLAWRINLDEMNDAELKAIFRQKVENVFKNPTKDTKGLLDDFLAPVK